MIPDLDEVLAKIRKTLVLAADEIAHNLQYKRARITGTITTSFVLHVDLVDRDPQKEALARKP